VTSLSAVEFYGQVLEWHDFAVIGLLVVLEGVLSIDNALVLGLLAKRLPKSQQSRALTYGLAGAFVFRLVAIGTAGLLLKWQFVKLIGGGYLIYIAVKHLFFESKEEVDETIKLDESGRPEIVEAATGAPLTPEQEALEIQERVPADLPVRDAPHATYARFWPTVLVIELTDIAFAVDSILAAIALVSGGPANPNGGLHPKLWLVLVGGMLGVILMRVAAVLFIRLLDRFPRFEDAAYLLVTLIGVKLLVDYSLHKYVDFHSPRHPAFWAFWLLMLICFCVGFVPRKQHGSSAAGPDGAE